MRLRVWIERKDRKGRRQILHDGVGCRDVDPRGIIWHGLATGPNSKIEFRIRLNQNLRLRSAVARESQKR
jgi:hypothetical protein